jgi:uncharacterized protein
MWIRDELACMDELANPVMGVSDWDDAVCIDFEGRLIASTDGPYDKRLVMKSALIHASTDVLAKGAMPIFALENMIGCEDDIRDMVGSVKRQAEFMGIPVIGGNTKIEDASPRACFSVFGRLLLDEPIRDNGAQTGDAIVLVGAPLWGGQEERLELAGIMFDAWYEIIDTVDVHAAKDVTKGGLRDTIAEMMLKSKRRFEITETPYHFDRNLDNIICTLDASDSEVVEGICSKRGCAFGHIGKVR